VPPLLAFFSVYFSVPGKSVYRIWPQTVGETIVWYLVEVESSEPLLLLQSEDDHLEGNQWSRHKEAYEGEKEKRDRKREG
jgi:hypothetical protein